jgi:hypothetical protein
VDGSYIETVSALDCPRCRVFPADEIAAALASALAAKGFRFDAVERPDASELVLRNEAVILSVCLSVEAGRRLLVAAETPCGPGAPVDAGRVRLLLCASATRVLCQLVAVERITWWHMGATHVTRGPGRAAHLARQATELAARLRRHVGGLLAGEPRRSGA